MRLLSLTLTIMLEFQRAYSGDVKRNVIGGYQETSESQGGELEQDVISFHGTFDFGHLGSQISSHMDLLQNGYCSWSLCGPTRLETYKNENSCKCNSN